MNKKYGVAIYMCTFIDFLDVVVCPVLSLIPGALWFFLERLGGFVGFPCVVVVYLDISGEEI